KGIAAIDARDLRSCRASGSAGRDQESQRIERGRAVALYRDDAATLKDITCRSNTSPPARHDGAAPRGDSPTSDTTCARRNTDDTTGPHTSDTDGRADRPERRNIRDRHRDRP